MEPELTSSSDEAEPANEEDGHVPDTCKHKKQQQLPLEQVMNKSDAEDDSSSEGDDNQDIGMKSSVGWDPCGTRNELKLLLEEKLLKLDTGDIQIVPSSAADGDEEDEYLIPRESAPEIEKPAIVERPFEDEITRLLKSIENQFPVRNNIQEKAEDYHLPPVSPKLFEIEDSYVLEDPDILFQFDDPESGILMEENITDWNSMVERLRQPDLEIVTDDEDCDMDVSEPFEKKDRWANSIDPSVTNQPGPSSRPDNIAETSGVHNMEITEIPDRMEETSTHMPSDLDEMMLPSLDSEDDRVLVDIDEQIKALPLSQPSHGETEFSVPGVVSESGGVLPVVPTPFDESVSAVPGTLDDERTLTGTLYEEASLAEVSEENNMSGDLRNMEMMSLELDRENESIESQIFDPSVSHQPDMHRRNQTSSSGNRSEDNTSPNVRGTHEVVSSLVLRTVVDDTSSPDKGMIADDEDEGSVVPSNIPLPNHNHVTSSQPVVNGKTAHQDREMSSVEMNLPVVPDEDTEELLRNLGALPKAGTVSLPGQRRYDSESVIKWEEDQLREFKGHRNVSAEEVPPWCLVEPRTRSPISRESSTNSGGEKALRRPSGGFMD